MAGLWLGLALAAALGAWVVSQSGGAGILLSLQAFAVVAGGSVCAALIQCPLPQLASALARLAALFAPSGLPSPEEAIAEVLRLARKAREEGGLLALQGEARDFAGGFLHRAVVVAVSAAETSEIRRIVEAEIKALRAARAEDANVFRALGLWAPMFGLLGTVLGIVRALQSLADPGKLGPSLAMALSSALIGIALAHLFWIPLAGRIRLLALQESLIREILLEGVLDMAMGKAPYLIELHLASYSRRRQGELSAAEAAPVLQVVS